MPERPQPRTPAAFAAATAAALCLAACGGSSGSTPATSGGGASAAATAGSTAPAAGAAPAPLPAPPRCQRAVTQTLGMVAQRAYRQLVRGRDILRTAQALERSAALRDAIAHADATAAGAAATAAAAGHFTRLQVTRGAQTLAAQGSATTLAPIRGLVRDRRGQPVARFAITALPAASFAQLVAHLTGSGVAIVPAAGGRPLTTVAAPTGVRGGSSFSFPAEAFPTGRLRILLSVPPAGRLCGRGRAATAANTIGQVAQRIYANEADSTIVRLSLRRVARDPALLAAVARDDSGATRAAVTTLVYNHTHIVRLRVGRGGHLLADVGGPFVLAPATGTLAGANGSPIGDFVLSLQDDLGYTLLTRRFTGAGVILRAGGRTVMGAIAGARGPIPDSGALRVGRVRYRLMSFDGQQFPAGTLRITVVVRQP